MNEWQDITTAPRDGTQVLLFSSKWGDIRIGSFRVDDGFTDHDYPEWLDNSHDDFSVGYASNPIDATHWMPLPDPPSPQESTHG